LSRTTWEIRVNTESSQCIACLDIDDSPVVPLSSNRLDFKVNAAVISQRSSKPVTAASLKKFTDAICEGNTRTVRRMVSECPQLARAPDASGRSALEITCRERPRARYLGPLKIGGDANVKHWRERAEIAEILIDYGADVNAKIRARSTLLHTVVDPIFSYRTDDVPPVELLRTLLDRGANPELSSRKGTVLLEAVENLRSERSKMMAPVIEVLLEYGADVLAVCEPWHGEPVYELVDELTKQGHKNLADLIRKRGAIRRKDLGLAVRAGVEEFLGRMRNADENALLSLEKELPWTRNIRILSVGRNLQKEYGSDLKDVGSIAALLLRGDWAEVTLPTGHSGDKAYMRIVLMRYPGGAYHAVEAGWTDGRDLGGRIRNASMHYDDLMNAIYSAFGWAHMYEVSGGRKTGYPRNIPLVSIRSEQGRLAVRGRNVPAWVHFRVELTPETVWHWDDTWSLNLASHMTFATDDRRMVLADGSLTVQNKDRIVVFTTSEGQVRMEADGKESLGKEFVLDLNTLEVAR